MVVESDGTDDLESQHSRVSGAVRAALAQPPRPPRDSALFTSTVLFGEPGIYPDGPPMAPASGAPLTEDAAAALVLDDAGDSATGSAAQDRFHDPALIGFAPAPTVRAGLALLVGTVGESLLDVLGDGTGPFGPEQIGLGPTASPGRVVGPAADDEATIVVNERYGAEHPGLLMPSLAHALLWSGPGAGLSEEVVLHALVAALHAQSVARRPSVSYLGTELARRQNSLTITLLNSRQPNDSTLSLISPDGPGTIPGGAPGMQTRDFASIPFASGVDPERSIPQELKTVLDDLCGNTGHDAQSASGNYDDGLLAAIRIGGDAGLSGEQRLRVAIALGMLGENDLNEIANRAGISQNSVVTTLGLAPSLAYWEH